MQKSNKLIYFLIFTVIFLAVFIFATIYDLQISQTLADLEIGNYYSANIYAIFFEIFGESILYVMLAMAFSVIFFNVFYSIKNFLKFPILILISVLIIDLYFLGAYRIFNYLTNYFELSYNALVLIILLLISFIFAFFSIILLKNIKKELIFKLFWFALLIIFVALISNLTTQIIKGEIFGRMRYRAMSYINDFSYYTPWYFFNDSTISQSLNYLGLPTDAFRSFPSGHTVACSISFCLIFLPKYFEYFNTKTGRFFSLVIPIFLTSLVGLARVIAGAHFLTDVLFAVYFVVLLTIVFEFVIYKQATKFLSRSKQNFKSKSI